MSRKKKKVDREYAEKYGEEIHDPFLGEATGKFCGVIFNHRDGKTLAKMYKPGRRKRKKIKDLSQEIRKKFL